MEPGGLLCHMASPPDVASDSVALAGISLTRTVPSSSPRPGTGHREAAARSIQHYGAARHGVHDHSTVPMVFGPDRDNTPSLLTSGHAVESRTSAPVRAAGRAGPARGVAVASRASRSHRRGVVVASRGRTGQRGRRGAGRLACAPVPAQSRTVSSNHTVLPVSPGRVPQRRAAEATSWRPRPPSSSGGRRVREAGRGGGRRPRRAGCRPGRWGGRGGRRSGRWHGAGRW